MSKHHHHHAKGVCDCIPKWYIDNLGQVGLPCTKVEDYAVPTEESHGGLFLPDRIKKGYHVEELKDGVYWVSGGWYDCTGNGVIVVDAPPALGTRLLDAIAEVTDEPVTHMVYSHWHADHLGAAFMFRPIIKRVAHEKTAGLLTRFSDKDRPVPTETFSKDAVPDVNFAKQALTEVELQYFVKELGEGPCMGAFRVAEENYFSAIINLVTKTVLEKTTSNGQLWPQRLNASTPQRLNASTAPT